jgi:WD40 repeat protein
VTTLVLLVGTGISTYFGITATYEAARARAEKRRADINAERESRERDLAGHHLYAARINLAQVAWERGQIPTLRRELDRLESDPIHREHRGWEWRFLSQFREQALRTFELQSRPTSVVFSPDGRFLYSGERGDKDQQHTLTCWDLSNNQASTPFDERTRIWGLAISPDGRHLATSQNVWDLKTGRSLLSLGNAQSVAFSPDAARVATTGGGHAVSIWNVKTGQRMPLETLAYKYLVARFRPDGRQLAAPVARSLHFWDTTTGQKVGSRTPKGSNADINDIAYSPNGKLLVAARNDGTIVLSDPENLQVLRQWDGHPRSAYSVAFSPDGKQLASGGDEAIKIWDSETGSLLRTLVGHTAQVKCVRYSPDGRLLASASDDHTVKLWDPHVDHSLVMPPPVVQYGVPRAVKAVAFHPDGTRLAIGTQVGSDGVVFCDVGTGRTIRKFAAEQRAFNRATSIAFSGDGRLMATVDVQGIRIWDVETARELKLLHSRDDHALVRAIAFSDDGRLAVGDEEHVITLYDVGSGEILRKLTGHSARICGVVFGPKGKYLVSAAYHEGGEPFYEGAIRIWDATTGEEIRSLPGSRGLMDIALSADGAHFAAGGHDSTIRIFALPSGEELRKIDQVSLVYALAFGPQGRLVSGGFDGVVRVWDFGTGVELYSLKNHTRAITCLSFSRDGRRLAAGSDDTRVSIWDAPAVTDEVRIEREAVGLVTFLFEQGLSRDDVADKISKLQTVPDSIRERALDLL